MRLTLNQLRAFLNLVEGGSFIEGARRQSISQPALSRLIRQMEVEIGARLFDRDTRNTSLTPIGRELEVITRRLITHIDEEFDRISHLSNGNSGTIHIAALPTMSSYFLPSTIASYGNAHPGIKIIVNEAAAEQVITSVLSGAADFGLIAGPLLDERFTWHELFCDRFGLVCRNDNQILENDECIWSIFENSPFISMAKGTSVRKITDLTFKATRIKASTRTQCSQLGSVGQLISEGVGITALPELSMPFIGKRNLAWRLLSSPIIDRKLGIITRAHITHSKATQKFIKQLIKNAQQKRTESEGDWISV
ncbi:LysR family transcriptional regulator [Dongshaea marina]|uniref:LysR family transcriptional regulator n=1 Tax=Dongshaea marina TaxID=2047966 RepID=UPI000D3E8FD8|nr:LysR family transcriptional regulator [Dongshaea marina]